MKSDFSNPQNPNELRKIHKHLSEKYRSLNGYGKGRRSLAEKQDSAPDGAVPSERIRFLLDDRGQTGIPRSGCGPGSDA
jgi:hypothetical protein